MSNWLEYVEFVDQIKGLHNKGFTGLVTGLSDSKHSFQIGFKQGDIILLAYRTKKGDVAFEKLLDIERAKITLHLEAQVPQPRVSMPNTRDILAGLINNTSSGNTELDDSGVDLAEPEGQRTDSDISKSKLSNSRLKTAIESAALHHFGPIASMICEEYLTGSDVSGKNYKTIMAEIATEVGSSKSDMDAFIDSVANPELNS